MFPSRPDRVKLPKTFLAVNLSEAFSFEEQERMAYEPDVLEKKTLSSGGMLSDGVDPMETEDSPTPVNEPGTEPYLYQNGAV